ncbi:nitroreductase family protein [Pseudalkalibacillus salsuginis]|uniref:nitroreductase family protein n=1 Tax=Pseudalkalibacillus salsuginis TaxID=2910972 RepID=UPI001F30B1D0|nr:nitroreductase [Pseudalkalibacillus salsuginis]MCF6408497.1 nitroreductase [Pseudalkalibacillus salsuginis]
MDVMKAIITRRTIGKVTEQVPDKEMIESILEAGTWAPSHYRTEPWKFIVLSGKGRDALGELYGEIAVESLTEPTDEEVEQAREKGLKKARRAPVIIVLIMEPSNNEKVVWLEEIAACACAAQNMMLAAHSLGLGSIWRTGQPTYKQKMKDRFGVSEKGHLMGFLYVGYPAAEPKPSPRRPVAEKTQWWDGS